jgi:hypothetical protein
MRTRRFRSLVIILCGTVFGPLFGQGQETLSLKDIIEKNLQASGGKEKLAQIRNISFRAGDELVTASSSFELKIASGKGSGEVILVSGNKARSYSAGQASDLTAIPNAVNQALARLYGGVFTLLGFEDRLEFRGTKSFGPEKFYHLATKLEPLEAGLFVRAEDFLLRRLVFQGQTPEGDKYEVNYDFSPFEDAEGVKLPLSWFRSQVGTRGILVELSEVKINQALRKDFFSRPDGESDLAARLACRPPIKQIVK